METRFSIHFRELCDCDICHVIMFYKRLEIRVAKGSVKMALSLVKMVKVPRQSERKSLPKFDTKLLLFGSALRLLWPSLQLRIEAES